MSIIDLTLTIENGMLTCGTEWHQSVKIERMGRLEDVGRNTHSILVGSHTGTHMDAPFHFIETGDTIEKMDVNSICGKVTTVDFRHVSMNQYVTLQDVKNILITEKMLFIFGWYKNWKTEKYYRGFPYFSEEAIDYLLSKGMHFMAMDTPSPDSGNAIGLLDDSPNHKKLLKKNVVIVEYLCNTDMIDVGKKYEIYALPIKIMGSDGAPCRVILKEVETNEKS